MRDTIETVTAYIEQHALLPEIGTVIVAVSGGADSLCLLHLLHTLCGRNKRYPIIQLHVAHLNHQLRSEASAQDAIVVAQLAESWGLPSTIGVTDVPMLARAEHRSLEDAARTARYRFLREVAQGQPIAVAHHQDDQVETLLLHWLRGGGIDSMVGLQPRQQDIIRPLLSITHAEALAYCQQRGLTPLEDASNTDTRFLRNRIRHELLPLLESMNPGFRATLLRNSEVMRVDAEWIEAQVGNAWHDVVLSEQDARILISVSSLRTLPLSLQRHMLRRITSKLSAGQSPLELRHHMLIEQLTQRKDNVKDVLLQLPDALVVSRNDDTMVFERVDELRKQSVVTVEHEAVTLSIPGSVSIPGNPWIAKAEILTDETAHEAKKALQYEQWDAVWRLLASTGHTVYVDADKIADVLQVRTRRPGDRIRPLGMAHEKKVQDILVDKHIARTERDELPLFFSSKHCIWLGGVCIDDRVRLTSKTQHIVRLSLTGRR